jgi:hypothetical protein
VADLYSADMTNRPGLSVNDLVAQSGFDRRTIVYYIQQGILPRVGRRGPGTRYPAECLTRLLFVRGVKDHQAAGRLPGITLADLAYALSVLKPEKVREFVERGTPLAELETLFPARPAAPVAYGRPMVTPGGWRSPAAATLPPAPAAPAAPPAVAAPVAPTATAAVTPPSVEPAGAAPPPAPAAPRPSLLERPPADKRSYGLADAGIRPRLGVTRPPDAPATPPAAATGNPADNPAEAPHHDDTQPRLPALTLPTGEPAYDLGELLRQLELRANAGRNRPPGAAEQWTEIPVTSRVYLAVRGLGAADAPVADAVARALKRALRGG